MGKGKLDGAVLQHDCLNDWDADNQVWDFVLVWIAGVAVVAYPALRDGWARRVLSARPLVWLGRISYGLYMTHELGLWAARRLAGRSWASDLPTSLVALGLTVALASGSYYGLERPFLRLKRRWTRVPSRPV